MGTSFHVQLQLERADVSQSQIEREIESRLAAVNASMSSYLDDSELMKFNRRTDQDWIAVSKPLALVVDAAQVVSHASGGAFDITVAPLVELWGFGQKNRVGIPSAAQIAQLRDTTGYQRLKVRKQPPALRKQGAQMSIDLSAIAKGYAVDILAEYCEQLGSQNYLIEIGGELVARGHNAQLQPWRVAIERPVTDDRAVQLVIQPGDNGIATSGDYRNFFEFKDQYYSHTLDPQTGRPVTHKLASVTVVHASSMWADAWATALLVLGSEQGLQLAEQQGLAAYFILRTDGDFKSLQSSAFSRYVQSD